MKVTIIAHTEDTVPAVSTVSVDPTHFASGRASCDGGENGFCRATAVHTVDIDGRDFVYCTRHINGAIIAHMMPVGADW